MLSGNHFGDHGDVLSRKNGTVTRNLRVQVTRVRIVQPQPLVLHLGVPLGRCNLDLHPLLAAMARMRKWTERRSPPAPGSPCVLQTSLQVRSGCPVPALIRTNVVGGPAGCPAAHEIERRLALPMPLLPVKRSPTRTRPPGTHGPYRRSENPVQVARELMDDGVVSCGVRSTGT